MNIILLSGGSGKRLWPLSNDIRSKQFIKLFKKEDGTYESMVQRIYRQIAMVDKQANITIATSKSQVSTLHNQLGDKVNICVEPTRRDTFPAIVLAASYLYDMQKIKKEEIVIVCPVDPYVDVDYFDSIKELEKLAKEREANLTLMGIEPTYPSEKYGYIIPETSARVVSKVKTFKEKPDLKTAKDYMKMGALWNGGVFAFQLGYILKKAHEIIDFNNYEDLYANYESLQKISFDYAVVEKETDIQVMRFSGQWKDLGTWNTLTEEMSDPIIGKAVLNETCEETCVVNELNIPVLCMGLKNMIVSVSGEGILVTTKDQSSYIKPFVDGFDQTVRFAEKSWGSFHIIDVEEESLTIKVTLNPGHSMNYHSHERRKEVWTIVRGEAMVIIDGANRKVRTGAVITLPVGCKHTIIAETLVQLIEVQIGKELSVQDKKKYNLEVETGQI
ncbi:sugar phosphate nucleotidyltransferase [Lacrimispora sp.]|uniref:sugar phosphate nucleotidyltransferase n=1 Tax=Lacrimispora sp. TaxID=2719234 RepID=UPI0032E4A0B9